jgi:hypothetical protein
MKFSIKVGILLSYDYEFLKNSLPCIYTQADSITLAMDSHCRTWSGSTFTIESSFFDWLEKFDIDKKITIYKDDFYLSDISPLENDTRERNMLAEFMGEGGWHIQIDADEYFIRFNEFVEFLKKQNRYLLDPQKTPITFIANLIVLYKKTKRGFLYVKGDYDNVQIATNLPKYESVRNTTHPLLYTNFFLFHQSWARSEDEMYFKLKNWGHTHDVDVNSYFKFWKNIDEDNYSEVNDFHPMYGPCWSALDYGDGASIDEFIQKFHEHNVLSLPDLHIFLKNNPRLENFYNRLSNLKTQISRKK